MCCVVVKHTIDLYIGRYLGLIHKLQRKFRVIKIWGMILSHKLIGYTGSVLLSVAMK